jgi:hypothetical protein
MKVCEISGSHGCEYVEVSLLVYSAVKSRWNIPTFHRYALPLSSGLFIVSIFTQHSVLRRSQHMLCP